ncbi:hypothetical protein CYMTET_43933 [Cymbomonas tetramitiformis]|uniref:Uncharacterized protein n=1 Tax=Cymbomonas tetramitiformis TaxID=36881 RepID=A0AAE0F167_9CHLO|nr:hypothetical protein CYMTET_43933 [Cymbomonas tetramitiformis]
MVRIGQQQAVCERFGSSKQAASTTFSDTDSLLYHLKSVTKGSSNHFTRARASRERRRVEENVGEGEESGQAFGGAGGARKMASGFLERMEDVQHETENLRAAKVPGLDIAEAVCRRVRGRKMVVASSERPGYLGRG